MRLEFADLERNLRRAEIRSGHLTITIALVHHRTNNVHIKSTPGYHPGGRKEPSRHPKSSLYCALSSSFSGLFFTPPLWSSFALSTITLSLTAALFFQNDVDEYLSGTDAAIERVLGAFQDALACVSCPSPRSTIV